MYAASDAGVRRGRTGAGRSERPPPPGRRAARAWPRQLKLANNFLSAIALAATSEAVAFGCSVGLDMATMLEVLNASSGQSNATSDKFPNHVLTGRYAAGFANSLMSKDLRLYLGAVEAQGAPSVLGPVTAAVWERFADAEPGADFTRIYPFVAASGPRGSRVRCASAHRVPDPRRSGEDEEGTRGCLSDAPSRSIPGAFPSPAGGRTHASGRRFRPV